MKKTIFSTLLLLISSNASAEMTSHPVNSNWQVLAWSDDFTDEKSCAVTTTKNLKRNSPTLIMFALHKSSTPHTILKANGSISGLGIKYRVDKKPAVQVGYEYEFQTDDDSYIITGTDHEKMISDFKSGDSLVYKVTSSNQYVDDGTEKVSLKGFTKAYSLAEQCKY